jgi:hypothetical protein
LCGYETAVTDRPSSSQPASAGFFTPIEINDTWGIDSR